MFFFFALAALASSPSKALKKTSDVSRQLLVEYDSKARKSVRSQIQQISKVLFHIEKENIFLIEPKWTDQKDWNPLQISKLDGVRHVEKNQVLTLQNAANDSFLSSQWGIRNFGQKDPRGRVGTAGIDIKAASAWKLTTGSPKVIVAVIDSGTNIEHPDLKANLWTNAKEVVGKPGVDDDGNGFVDDIHGFDFLSETGKMIDDNGHGTHCAGIIGAKGGNRLGIAGVTWSVRLMSVRFADRSGSGTLADSIRSVHYAVDNGAHVISSSWGGDGYSKLLKQAIEKANRKNIPFVAAAGNHRTNTDQAPYYPASYKIGNVIAVAAIDNRGQLARFSNFGKESVHVSAPGVNIYSTFDQHYKSLSGTSMATPFVSGVIALLLAQERVLTPKKIRQKLIESSTKTSRLQGATQSGGFINAFEFLKETP